MHEISEEDLLMYYYGEIEEPAAIERALHQSAELQARYDDLCRLLDATRELQVPEPPADYGDMVWQQLEPRLAEEQQQPWWHGQIKRREGGTSPSRSGWRRLAAALAVVALAAFWLGRQTGPTAPSPSTPVAQAPAETSTAEPNSADAILQAALAEHLERSGRLLVELSNTAGAGDGRDLGAAIDRADDLLAENRLYRLAGSGHNRTGRGEITSLGAGQDGTNQASAGLVVLLEALERILLDISHASPDDPARTLENLRQRIDSEDLLFKVRVSGARLSPPGARSLSKNTPGTPGADV